MSTDRDRILEYLDANRAYLRSHYHLRKIALIGSFARNDATDTSDIDLLVDFEPGTPDLFELKAELRRKLEQHFGRRIELAPERYLKPYYRDAILADAIYVE